MTNQTLVNQTCVNYSMPLVKPKQTALKLLKHCHFLLIYAVASLQGNDLCFL